MPPPIGTIARVYREEYAALDLHLPEPTAPVQTATVPSPSPPVPLPDGSSRVALRFSETARPYTEPVASNDLKVITVNAYLFHSESPVINLFFDTPNPRERAIQLGEWIREQNADIVFLQEVWHLPYWREILHHSGF